MTLVRASSLDYSLIGCILEHCTHTVVIRANVYGKKQGLEKLPYKASASSNLSQSLQLRIYRTR
jgi:hypothetical protein